MKLLKLLTNLQKIDFNRSVSLLEVCSKNTRYIKRNSGSINSGVGSFSDMDFLKLEPKPKLVVFDLGNFLWLLQNYLSGCFWLIAPKFWEGDGGPMNGSFSFYNCRLSDGNTHTLSAII